MLNLCAVEGNAYNLEKGTSVYIAHSLNEITLCDMM